MIKILALSSILFSLTAFAESSHVVLISDSHSLGEFGRVLAGKIRSTADHSFYYFASGGSAPLQWLNGAFTTPCGLIETHNKPVDQRLCQKLLTPKLADIWLAQKVAPDTLKITVIIQGTNLSHKTERRSQEIAWAKKLAAVASEKSDECYWVGPPQMKRAGGFDAQGVQTKVAILQEALAGSKCQFIDSRLISTYPAQGDGIHYHWPGSRDASQLKAAADWATALAPLLNL